MGNEKTEDLQKISREIRKKVIQMIGKAKSGHPGGSLSAADIMTVLYFDEMKIDVDDPRWEDRDRFVLSKGHAAPVLYATLAEKGFFPAEELETLRQIDSRLQGHPDMKKVPGVDMSTGSLGQGLSAANGMALAAKMDGKDYRVFVLLGDGENQEGEIWEAAMLANQYKLDNIIAFLDYNGLQIDGKIVEVMSPEPLDVKWAAFGWHVERINGNDIDEILAVLERVKRVKKRPVMIIANTVKGKGVEFMENQAGWHGKAPSAEQVEEALQDIEKMHEPKIIDESIYDD